MNKPDSLVATIIAKQQKFMLDKIEHLGIAVKSLEISDSLFAKLIGREAYKMEEVEREGVKTSFYQIGESKIELLESTREDSPISKFIEKKGEGVHHIAFGVDDIYAEIERLKKKALNLFLKNQRMVLIIRSLYSYTLNPPTGY